MNTQDVGAFQNRHGNGAGGSISSLVHRSIHQVADKLPSGDADQHRMPEFRQRVELREQLEVMLLSLPKPEAGVKNDLTCLDTGIQCRRIRSRRRWRPPVSRSPQWRSLHGARSAPVCIRRLRPCFSHQAAMTESPQGGDVVDDRRPASIARRATAALVNTDRDGDTA